MVPGFVSYLHDHQVHRKGPSAGRRPVLVFRLDSFSSRLPLLTRDVLQNMGGSAGSPTHSGYWGSNGNLIQLDAQALLAQQQALSMLQSSSGLDRQVGCLQASCGPACLPQALLQHHSSCTQMPSGAGYKLQSSSLC